MTLRKELSKLLRFQPDIMLVYHPTRESTWGDRCLFLEPDTGYSETKAYNHRSVLPCEVVIEYDTPSMEDNARYVERVCKSLRADNIKYSKWFSGNKSIHLHVLLDIPADVRNRKLLKRSFMRYYGTLFEDSSTKKLYTATTKPESLGNESRILPDLALDSDNHLIRAEYGVHESSGKNKNPLGCSQGYAKELSVIPSVVWEEYKKAQAVVIQRRTVMDVQDALEHPGVKLLLDTSAFRELGDGRSRALFHLITILKNKYSRDELVSKLDDWYRYCTSFQEKLTRGKIAYFVDHNIRQGYQFSISKFNDFLEEIGREDLILPSKNETLK